MASTSSRSSARGRDKDKAVRGGAAARDSPEALFHVTNNYFDNAHINGTVFGAPANEQLEQSRRSPRTARARPNGVDAASMIRMARGVIPNQVEEADADLGDDETDREYSFGEEPARPPFPAGTTPTTQERVQDWRRDSGYVGSTRRSKGGRNEAYRASEKDASTNASLRGHSPHGKRKIKAQSVGSSELDAEASVASENQRSLRSHRDAEGGAEEDDEEDNADDSGDDFARRHMQVATEANKQIKVRVMLDTGTKPNWISYHFLTNILGKKNYNKKLNDGEEKEYTDISGNNFSPIGKADVMVHSADFGTEKGSFPCRTLSFMVIQRSNITILLGRDTIKKENLLCMPPASQNSKAFPAVLSNPKKSGRAAIAQNKEKQNKEGAERDKVRQEAAKAKAKEKKEAKSSTSSTAMLAQESTPRRRRRSLSPSRNSKQVSTPNTSWKKTKPPLNERSSSASSSGGGAALND